MSSQPKALVIIVALILVSIGRANALSTEDTKCRGALGKGVSHLVKTVVSEEDKCHKARMGGDPAFAAIDCSVIAQLPQKSQDKITKAESKLAGAGGVADKKCGQGGASTPSSMGYRTCPSPCGSVVISDYPSVGACLACLAKSEAGTAVGTAYGPNPPTVGKSDALTCQATVGQSELKYTLTRMTEQQKCQALADTHKAPTTPTTDCKSADLMGKVAAAETKANTAISDKCTASLPSLTSCAASVATESTCVDASADQCADHLFDDVYPPVGGAPPPTLIHVPSSYVPGTAMPLVVLLHGYGAWGALQEAYFKLTPLSDSRGFLYAYPDGTLDSAGNRFWNATDACCNFDASPVDDVAYITNIIADMSFRYTVDPKRIFIVGHSNGAFMAHRLACERSGQIAAIVSLAGAMWQNLANCTPSDPVSVLQIHGTADTEIDYNGGTIGPNAYPSAQTTVNDWVAFDSCSNVPDLSQPPLDLDTSLAGSETTVARYATSCTAGTDVELWTMQGGSHIPALSAQFPPDIVGFLLAHPKP